MQVRTVFLDRDGVINRRPGDGYVTRPEDFHFLDGAKQAIASLTAAGARVFVVTNQRGIAHGLMSEADLARIHAKMIEEVEAAGGRIDAAYHCPHHPDQCDCKKPKPGMLLAAKRDFPEVRFEEAVMIGDSLRDLEAGDAVGCQGILVGPREQRDSIVAIMNKRSIPLLAQEPSLWTAVTKHVLPRMAFRRAS